MKPVNDPNSLWETLLTDPTVNGPHIEANGLYLLTEVKSSLLKMN